MSDIYTTQRKTRDFFSFLDSSYLNTSRLKEIKNITSKHRQDFALGYLIKKNIYIYAVKDNIETTG